MNMIAFDTLKLVAKLKSGGFSMRQAEAAAEALADISAAQTEDLATKQGLTDTANMLKADIANIANTTNMLKADIANIANTTNMLKADIAVLEQQMNTKIESAKVDTIKWVVGVNIATIGLLFTILKLTAH